MKLFQVYIAFLTYFYISLVNFRSNYKAEKILQIDAQKESNLTLTIFAFVYVINMVQNTLNNPRLVLLYS